MKRLTTYITLQLLFTVFAITIVLTGVAWLTQTLRFIELIASNAMPINIFLKVAMYLIPNFFVIVMPIAFLIGVIFIYNKLENDHELVIMRSAGMSCWQMATPVMLFAVFATALLYVCTLYLVPLSSRKYGDLSSQFRQHSLASFVSSGQFDTFGKLTVYTKSQDSQGNFLGILIYDARLQNKSITYMAEKGVVFGEEAGAGILLIKGNRQEIDDKTQRPSILYFDEYTLKTQEKESVSEKRFLKTHERSVGDLFYPKGQVSPQMRLEFLSSAHQRLISPLYVPAFGFVAVCFMILGHFNRRGRARKIFIACTIAVLLEASIMICLHNVSHLPLMLVLSYTCIIGAIVIPLFLLSPLADTIFNRSLRRRN